MPSKGFIGSKDLVAKLGRIKNAEEVSKLIRKHTTDMAGKSNRNATNFRGHYEWVAGQGLKFTRGTGNLRRSMKVDIEPKKGEVTYTAEYAGYVEYGTRFSEAQPFLLPAYNEEKEKLKSDLKKLVS